MVYTYSNGFVKNITVAIFTVKNENNLTNIINKLNEFDIILLKS